jgi:hypothetical protein
MNDYIVALGEIKELRKRVAELEGALESAAQRFLNCAQCYCGDDGSMQARLRECAASTFEALGRNRCLRCGNETFRVGGYCSRDCEKDWKG